MRRHAVRGRLSGAGHEPARTCSLIAHSTTSQRETLNKWRSRAAFARLRRFRRRAIATRTPSSLWARSVRDDHDSRLTNSGSCRARRNRLAGITHASASNRYTAPGKWPTGASETIVARCRTRGERSARGRWVSRRRTAIRWGKRDPSVCRRHDRRYAARRLHRHAARRLAIGPAACRCPDGRSGTTVRRSRETLLRGSQRPGKRNVARRAATGPCQTRHPYRA